MGSTLIDPVVSVGLALIQKKLYIVFASIFKVRFEEMLKSFSLPRIVMVFFDIVCSREKNGSNYCEHTIESYIK